MQNHVQDVLTGTLRQKRAFAYVLELPDGSECWLDIRARDMPHADRYRGRRVTVEGLRADFDLLNVQRFGLVS